jgi:protein-disulfide isomerase
VSKKGWIIFASVCVVLLGALVVFSMQNRLNVSDVDTGKVLSGSEKSGRIGDHVYGKKDSKVIFTEYGDFQCPGCGNAHPTIKEVTEKYKDQLAFVFRNFPLTSIHPNARAAASAAEAAGKQGKYWEIHNMLYESQQAWGSLATSQRTDYFLGYTDELKLNKDTFQTDMTSPEVSQKINFDMALGKKDGVSATPTFFLNGKKMDNIYNAEGGVDKEKLEKVLVDAMKQAGIELPKE